MSVKVAIVAAMEREVSQLVKSWRVVEREHEGKTLKFFENGADAVLICAGIGEQPARRAAEAVIAIYKPEIVQSVGFGGALDSKLKVGGIISPARVIDAKDGSSVVLENGAGVLLSVNSTAGMEQKAKLAEVYGAQAVDMEAAAVAKSAAAHGIAFRATKAISDEFDFEMPQVDRFVSYEGNFQTKRFLAYAALRPWLWNKLVRLARNSKKAADALCAELSRQLKASANSPELQATTRV